MRLAEICTCITVPLLLADCGQRGKWREIKSSTTMAKAASNKTFFYQKIRFKSKGETSRVLSLKYGIVWAISYI